MTVLGGLIYLNTHFLSRIKQTNKNKETAKRKQIMNENIMGEISKAGQNLPEVQIFLRHSFVCMENCDPELKIEAVKYVVSND